MDNLDLAQALALLVQSILDGKEFVLAHAPEVIRQLLLYNTVWYMISAVLSVAGIAAGIILVRKAAQIQTVGKKIPPLAKAYEAGIFMGVVGSVTLIITTHKLMLITLAPSVWLLEYAASLVR